MSFVTLTIQRLLNLYRRAGSAWKCLSREAKKYEGLKSYFLSASGAGDCFIRLKNAFRDPMLEIYWFFCQGVLRVFNTFNKYLQREVPLIYQLSYAQKRFMNKLAARFMKPEAIQETKSEEKSFAKLDISLKNRKGDIDLGIGILTKRKVKQLLENENISQEAFDKFFDVARAFFFSKAHQYYLTCCHWRIPFFKIANLLILITEALLHLTPFNLQLNLLIPSVSN